MTTNKPQVIVIDDQLGNLASARQKFTRDIQGERYDLVFCSAQHEGRNSINVALDAVKARWPPKPNGLFWSVVLLDVQFDSEPSQHGDDRFGFAILEALRQQYGPQLPVLMLTREGHDLKRRLAGRAAADGYLEKEGLTDATMQDALELRGYLEDSRPIGDRLVGRSIELLSVLRDARLYAKQYGTNPRLGSRILYGETGSGKTELAKYIHLWSARGGDDSFRKWTAEGKDEEMAKDGLFGHWRGAHNLANSSEPGEIERAHGGTFFLDEIANLPPQIQNLLLEFRRRDSNGHRTITRLGPFPSSPRAAQEASDSVLGHLTPNHKVCVDVLALWATNALLRDPSVRKELRFRTDLYRSLQPEITLPPLNSRRGDIPLLFAEFLTVARQGRHTTVDAGVIDQLQNHDWTDKNIVPLGQLAEYVATMLGNDFNEVLPRHLKESGLFDDDYAPSVAIQPATASADHAPEVPRLTAEPLANGVDALLRVLESAEIPDDHAALRGLLPRLQTAYARLLLRVLGAALRAMTNKKTDKASTLDAVSLLLDRKSLTRSGKAQSKKAYDVVRRLVATADAQFSLRSADECVVLSDDNLVVQHVNQALRGRAGGKPADAATKQKGRHHARHT